MKVLIQSFNGGAHIYTNLGLARAFDAMGYQAYIWNTGSVFDTFDKINPDIFLGQTYNLNKSIIKAIEERPHMRVILRASDRSSFANEVAKKYPILVANEEEIKLVNKLRDLTGEPTLLHNHYTQESINKTHEDWIKEGFNVKSSLLAADLFSFYNGKYNEKYETDLVFCGGRWGYKAKTIDPYLLQFCNDNYRFKIFGNQGWGVYNYCGFAPDTELKNILKSSKICLNVHEPHSQEYGYDIIERPYKLLSNRCFCISDYVQDLVDLIPDGIVYCQSPEEYREKVDYFLKNPDEREKFIENGHKTVIHNHTYFERVADFLDELNLSYSKEIKEQICGLSFQDQGA